MPEENKALALISDIDRAVVGLETITQAVDLQDMARAANVFFIARGMDQEALRAMVLWLKADRRAGEMLLEMDKATGGQPYQATGSSKEPVGPTLADMGITKKESYYWQHMALVPQDTFDEYISRADKGEDITRSGALALMSAKYNKSDNAERTNLDIAGELIRQLRAVIRNMNSVEVEYVKGLISGILLGLGDAEVLSGADPARG